MGGLNIGDSKEFFSIFYGFAYQTGFLTGRICIFHVATEDELGSAA